MIEHLGVPFCQEVVAQCGEDQQWPGGRGLNVQHVFREGQRVWAKVRIVEYQHHRPVARSNPQDPVDDGESFGSTPERSADGPGRQKIEQLRES